MINPREGGDGSGNGSSAASSHPPTHPATPAIILACNGRTDTAIPCSGHGAIFARRVGPSRIIHGALGPKAARSEAAQFRRKEELKLLLPRRWPLLFCVR